MICAYIHDVTWWSYIANLVSALWGLGLFSWWWVKTQRITHERPSSVYMCLWVIFLGESWDAFMSLYMRGIVLNLHLNTVQPFFMSWIWTMRTLPIILGMFIIDFLMTYRIIFKKTVFKANGHKTIFVEEGQIANALITNAEIEELHLYRMVDAHIKSGTIKLAVIYDALIKDMDTGNRFDEHKD
jgi:hypothetical protein